MIAPFYSGQEPERYIPELNEMVKGSVRRNAVIGGDFSTNPWQRGVSFVSPALGDFLADMWKTLHVTDGAFTVTREADAPTVAQAGKLITHCLRVDITTIDAAIDAAHIVTLTQIIEGYRWVGFAQQTLSVRFWHRHTKTGVHCVSFRNIFGDRSLVMEYTQMSSDVWEEAILELPASPSVGVWDYTTGIGLFFDFSLASGTNYNTTAGAWQVGNFLSTANAVNNFDSTANFFRIADVRLSLSPSSDSQFMKVHQRSLAEEMELCQRYYSKSFYVATAPAQNIGGLGAPRLVQRVGAAAASNWGTVTFPVRMRATPTIVLYNPSAANAQMRNVPLGADCSATSASLISDRGFLVVATSAAGSAVGELNAVHWSASADLS